MCSTVAEQPVQTNWPIKTYVFALVFAFLSMAFLTVTLSGAEINAGRSRAQLAVCLILALRLMYAIGRREQSRTWMVYVTAMVFAVPIWWIIEPIIFSLAGR